MRDSASTRERRAMRWIAHLGHMGKAWACMGTRPGEDLFSTTD